MLTRRWRPGIALLAVAGLVSLAALPAAPALDAAAAPADGIQAKQQWVLNMLNTEAAWSVTRGAGVTVAVIDSGVNPDVSDLSGSVITGPDYTGVTTSPSSPQSCSLSASRSATTWASASVVVFIAASAASSSRLR